MEEWKNGGPDYECCEYSEETYCERDTWYAEYECELTGEECYGEYCPLMFKYKIEV